VPGDNDTISFQIGWPLWWMVGVSLVSVLFISFKTKKFLTGENILFFFLLLVFAFSIFMTHNRSALIWEQIPLLAYVQFPWRFLAMTIFTGSLLGVWWLQYLPKRAALFLVIVLSFLTILLNYQYFAPEKFFPDMTNNLKLSGTEWETQQKAAILDYLPKGANKPVERAPEAPFIVKGVGSIKDFQNYTDHFRFTAQTMDQSLIEIPIFDYPNWETYVDGVKISHSNDNYLKRMDITLGPGSYTITGKLQNTPIRIIANLVTVLALIFFIYISVNGQVRKRFS
jgi:hypothetical protein